VIPATLAELVVPIESLRPYGRNPRRGNVAAIRRSLEANGQYRPIVARAGTGEVLAGNHTLQAAVELGWESIAATFVDVDDEEAARIVLIDNRANDLAGYDDEALADLLRSLPELEGTGFVTDDLDRLLADLTELPASSVPELPVEPVTELGDLWRLGDHRLLCGDCRDPKAVDRLLAGAEVQVAFTSPPYADRREYDEDSGFRPIPPEEYVDWFEPVQANVAAHLADDGSWFVNIKPSSTPDFLATELYVLDLVLAHARRWGWLFATEFCWQRVGVPKRVVRRFKNQFEPVYQFTRGDWKIRPDAVRHFSPNVPLPAGAGVGQTTRAHDQGTGQAIFGRAKKRQRNNLKDGAMGEQQGSGKTRGIDISPGLAYPGNLLPTFGSSHEATGHAAAFPVGLPAFFCLAYADPGEAVYDPFLGSGSTILAAHHTGRVGYGMEISPRYCDVTVERWQRHTGRKARRGRRG